MERGIVAGYPMTGVRAILYDGSYHDVDSSEMAFKIAGSMAFQEGAKKAGPILLEPIMDVEVVTPEDYAGDVMGDLSRRRGKIQADGRARRREGHPGPRAAVGDVRLRNAGALDVAGTRQLHDAVPGVRAGAEDRGRRSHRQGRGNDTTNLNRETGTQLSSEEKRTSRRLSDG